MPAEWAKALQQVLKPTIVKLSQLAEGRLVMFDLVGGALKIAGLIPGLAALPSRHFARRTRRALAALVFWQDGTLVALRRIAAGKGTKADLDEIAQGLRATQDETAKAAEFLAKSRREIAELFGPGTAQQIDIVVWAKMAPGEGSEPEAVRANVRRFVEQQCLDQNDAQYLLGKIEGLNEAIRRIDVRLL